MDANDSANKNSERNDEQERNLVTLEAPQITNCYY